MKTILEVNESKASFARASKEQKIDDPVDADEIIKANILEASPVESTDEETEDKD